MGEEGVMNHAPTGRGDGRGGRDESCPYETGEMGEEGVIHHALFVYRPFQGR